MTTDINELRLLAQAVIHWGCCNQAWLDQSEDTPAAVVGHINEDGETYPVVTIDCDQYSAAGQSLPLGKFYAAANPAVVNEILNRLEAAEEDIALKEKIIDALGAELNAVANERDDLLARSEAMENQEPSRGWWDDLIADISAIDCMYRGSPTYAHDAYWMRDRVVQVLEQRRDSTPGVNGEAK